MTPINEIMAQVTGAIARAQEGAGAKDVETCSRREKPSPFVAGDGGSRTIRFADHQEGEAFDARQRRAFGHDIDPLLRRFALPADKVEGQQPAEELCTTYLASREEHLRNGRGFVLYGPRGRSKTYSIVGLLNSLMAEGVVVRYAAVPELLARVKRSFNDPSAPTQDELVGQLVCGKLVALDEIGVGNPTPWMREMLYDVVDRARRKGLAIIGATNLDADALRDHLRDPETGEGRVYDRLVERSPIITVGGVDWREVLNRQAVAALAAGLGE